MKVVSVVSPKGGVGKTTVTVNLAVALMQSGLKVLVVDLDPQSALRFHFNLDLRDPQGLARCAMDNTDLRSACIMSPSGVAVLPFGDVEEDERATLERLMQEDSHWLRQRLAALGLARDTVVLLDTPPGASAYQRQALDAAQIALVVTLPDASSYATLAGMDKLLRTYCTPRPDFLGAAYIVNQMDATRQLSRDVCDLLRSELGSRLIGVVHLDTSVGEAVAFRRSVIEYAPSSRARQDLLACADWLRQQLLGGTVALGD